MRTQEIKTTKVTINVWRPVWSRLEAQIVRACLKRDAYIDKLINREIELLDAEVSIPNSEIARKYIGQQLRSLSDFTPLSIALDSKTAEKIDDVCSRKRIVRDSFFNRLFLFLALGSQLPGRLFFRGWPDEKPNSWTNEVWRECKHDGPFFENVFDPFAALGDPLWPIRSGLELVEREEKPELVDRTDPDSGQIVPMVRDLTGQFFELPKRFYTIVLTDTQLRKASSKAEKRSATPAEPGDDQSIQFHNLFGLNCYLPNHHVPTHPDRKTFIKAFDDFLSDL